MEATLNIYDLITASVFILNIFVAGIFFIKNFKVSLTHKIISILLFLLLIRTFSIHLYLSGNIINFPHWLLVSHLVSRFALPLLFLMLVFECYQRKFKWYDVLHFIPLGLFVLNYAQLYLVPAEQKKEWILLMEKIGYDAIWQKGSYLTEQGVYLIRVLPFLIYVLVMPYLYYKYKKKRIFSKTLEDFFLIIIIYMALNLISVILANYSIITGLNDMYEINLIGFGSTLFILTYFFFIPGFLNNSVPIEKYPSPSLNEISVLNQSRMDQIEQYLKIYKSFLNPDFTITQLEKEINIPARQISKSIQVVRNQNFNQFINEFRINHLLSEINLDEIQIKNYTDLAYLIGFNSVNNFYMHFKNYTGCTPKIYFEKQFKNK